MPPLRLNLPQRPAAAAEGAAVSSGTGNGIDGGNSKAVGGAVGKSAVTIGVGTPITLGVGTTGPWSTWPLLVMDTVHSTVKAWFKRMDVALLALPRGLGPIVSALVSNANGDDENAISHGRNSSAVEKPELP